MQASCSRILRRCLQGVLLAAVLLAIAFLLRVTRVSEGLSQAVPAETRREINLGETQPESLYALTVAVKNSALVQGDDCVRVTVADASGVIAEKWLHAADLDLYLTLRPRARGPANVTLAGPDAVKLSNITIAFKPIPLEPEAAHSANAATSVAPGFSPAGAPTGRGATPVSTHQQLSTDHRLPTTDYRPAVIAAQPNGTWRSAQPFEFGQTIYGSADERPYAPAPSEDAYAAMLKGFQWFRFSFHGAGPRLAYFVLGITDRDVPLDVDIFQLGKDASGKPDVVPYTDGRFIYQIEATQNYPGLYKFQTRILKPGQTYYLRVAANHPAYQLRTYDYPVPPYKDPYQAVKTGMDFLVNLGDTWLSNTPRRGSVALRTTQAHSETQLCIACHPTQFTTRGYLTAVQNGYPPVQRPSLEFLTDRIYNNARPLYGEPGTNWVRIIYSARTVASRLPIIEHLFEANITHDPPRPRFGTPYGNFLKIHYKNRKEMPGNETDGCEPDVSPFEIATESWETFGLLYKQTGDKQWLDERDMVEHLAVPYKPKNMIDLNWKIHFLATLGREKYARQLDELIQQLYSYQCPDGMWPYPFDKNAKSSDFISYHSVLALALAGRRPETDPPMACAVESMMNAQRPEGSWEGDPVYQGFNTPFRATEFAVMALSTLYPGPLAAVSTGSAGVSPALNDRPAGTLAPVGVYPQGRDRQPRAPLQRTTGWGAGFPPPPTHLARNDLPRLLYQLDQYWDLAPEPVLRQIRNVLATSDQPLAREAAARALGHMADPGAIEVLIKALGDQSKMVQSTAAWALRMILSRRQDVAAHGRALLAAALRSPDARRRWGATRLFNQHFKYLADDQALLRALTQDLDDPVPYVRFQAASGLWRWYYWEVDKHEPRTAILEALAARLNTETNPMVRRGLQESVYDLLDENTGYMAAWIKTASTEEDKDRIENGYEAVVRDQAQVLARVLRAATPLGREGILIALWDFHTRHMALPPVKADTVSIGLPKVFTQYVEGVPDLHRPGYVYPPYRETVDFKYDVHNRFYQTRVGNDSDLIHFFRSSGPELAEALVACLKGADETVKINVLKAGSTLSGAGDERFALAALQLSLDPDKEVRQTVRYVYENGQRGILNLNVPQIPDSELVKTVVEILGHGNPDSQAVVLPLLASLPGDSAWTRQPEVVAAMRSLLARQPRPQNYAEVLNAASSFETLMSEPRLRDQVLQGLNDSDSAVQRAAVQIALERFLGNPQTAPLVDTAFARLGSSQRNILIEEVNDPKFTRRHLGVAGGAIPQDKSLLANKYAYKEYKDPDFLNKPAVLKAVIESLDDRDANVRAAALDLLRKVEDVENRPDFRAAIERLKNDPNPRLQTTASNVLAGKTLSEALKDVKAGKILDYDFFVTRVEPILAKPGPDGKACVMCHASHVIFKLQPPSEQGIFSTQDSEQNFKYALRVVDVSNPEHSLILIKPTRPPEAGNEADYYASHNGGQRWQGNESSWEYKTILQWIRGARLQASSRGQVTGNR